MSDGTREEEPPTHYLRQDNDGSGTQVWRIQDSEAVRLGVSNPEQGAGTYIKRGKRASIWAAFREDTPWFTPGGPETGPFHRLDLPPAHYYRRIARPLNGSFAHPKNPGAGEERDTIAVGAGQARALTHHLDRICQTVHPHTETLGVYGHEIRNLLILAATEVEAHWRGVLVANGRSGQKLNTNDYVRLLPVMRLDQYAVGFRPYPWLTPIRPFAGWNSQDPTKTLPWYDAYNRVKHDRETQFSDARLEHTFNAVAACVIMLAAQYTPSIGLGGHSDLSSFFQFAETPEWTPEQSYASISHDQDGRWVPVDHPALVRK
ncbi:MULTISPECIES: hypothetical protein [Rhizobium]|nr:MULTISPECIES: hypothetical protein [Rhizobium]AVC45529.1 hypothetical protein RLV_1777 [Rhizobium leguminosarum bv. viciae]MBB4342960.1 hypothetical protein [Rhizobium leguminosarum]MBB6296038.1 hypothetical protein [Rhizobium leguminosarum]MBX5161445.1 hypothetical protein [Rhizobium sp. NZLR8]MBY3027274.1 hypothetical protein [Rhizobium leguminosarum]